jgi:hypothetical protein
VYDSASSLALSLSEEQHHDHQHDVTGSGPLPQAGMQAAAAAAEPAAAPAKRCMSLQELHDLAAPVPEVSAAAAAAPANSADSSAHTAAAASGVGDVHHSSSSTVRPDADSQTGRSKSCPELIKEMTVEEIVQHYRLFVSELSDELVSVQQEKMDSAQAAAAADGAGAAAAAWPGVASAVKSEDSGGFSSLSEQRLQQLTERCGYMFRMAATLNPGRPTS